MKIFAMVNTLKSQDFTGHALSSFFRAEGFSREDKFFLIDNDSSLAGAEVEKYNLEHIKNKTPLGFSVNVNQMMKEALNLNADLFFLNNDLIFPKNWMAPLLTEDEAILSPLTNREVHYPKPEGRPDLFGTRMTMELQEYLGHENEFENIAAQHAKNHGGYLDVLALPYCCVKIPLRIMREVGFFDENFGIAGAEDYDYSMRASLAGFSTKYAMQSYVLHFGGKSSWSGAENKEETAKREAKFRRAFQEKWGDKLYDLVLNEIDTVLSEGRISSYIKEKNFSAIIRELMKK